MVNVNALREIIPVLRRLEEQNRFRMGAWAQGVVNPNSSDWTDCGTQFCLAGAKAAYDGWVPEYEISTEWIKSLGRYLDVPVPTGQFLAPGSKNVPADCYSEGFSAEEIAYDAFGLEPGQNGFLFYCTHVSLVDHMVRRIEWLCDGNDPEKFPAEWVAEEHNYSDWHSEERQRFDAQMVRAAGMEPS